MADNNQKILKEAKQQLGQIHVLDCRHEEIITAHHRLGTDARDQIHKILAQRLNQSGGVENAQQQIRRARKLHLALSARQNNPKLSQTVRSAVAQYMACLQSWAEGASLDGFAHSFIADAVDELPVSAMDLAVFLQEDEVGCQTGVLREQDGAAILWHTEEDYEDMPGQRFDKLRLFRFKTPQNKDICGFIYPDLLPGPTFGWHEGDYAQAVDSLHTRQVDDDNAILPNVFAWISLYLGKEMPHGTLAAELGPFAGGYSVTSVRQNGATTQVEKVDFANRAANICTLQETPAKYLFQTNIVNPTSPAVLTEEHTTAEGRARNSTRIRRTTRLLKVIKNSNTALRHIFRMIRSRMGNEWAYSNPDVKGYFICKMGMDSTHCWVGAGPALPNDEPLHFVVGSKTV